MVSALIALVAITGCGKKKEAPAPEARGPVTFEITGNDVMKFNLTRLEVKAGEQVTLIFTNIGSMPKAAMAHNWTLLNLGVDPAAFDQAAVAAVSTEYFPEKLADEVIAHTKLLGPRQSDQITFTAPSKPGNYDYLCTFPGHFQAGMKGVLVVE